MANDIDRFFDELNSNDLIASSKSPNVRKLGYVYDPNKIALSFSRLAVLHSCPRKFFLREICGHAERKSTIDMAYGSAFGAGVQQMFRTPGDLPRAMLAALAHWDYEEFDDPWGKKKDKSLAMCLYALEVFFNTQYPIIAQEYRLAWFGDRPGIEPLVYIIISESYNYQMHIDLILERISDGALSVWEIKTSGMMQQEANWGNADQTAGYYTVLEYICKKYNRPFDPSVTYITQQTGKILDSNVNFGFSIFTYQKNPKLGLDFVRSTLLTIEQIESYVDSEYFPKRGASCVTYNSPCQFYGLCDLQAMMEESAEPDAYESLTLDDCDFVIDLSELINSLELKHT